MDGLTRFFLHEEPHALHALYLHQRILRNDPAAGTAGRPRLAVGVHCSGGDGIVDGLGDTGRLAQHPVGVGGRLVPVEHLLHQRTGRRQRRNAHHEEQDDLHPQGRPQHRRQQTGHGAQPPAVDQIETNLYCQRSAERGWMDKKQVAHMAYAPLGQGNRNEMFREPAVLALAEKYGKTPAQVLLRFLTQKGIAVIPRSTQPEHIRENFALFDFKLTADELDW